MYLIENKIENKISLTKEQEYFSFTECKYIYRLCLFSETIKIYKSNKEDVDNLKLVISKIHEKLNK